MPVSGILIDIYRILFSSGQDSVKAATGFHIWQLLLIILGVLILIGSSSLQPPSPLSLPLFSPSHSLYILCSSIEEERGREEGSSQEEQ